MFASNLNQVNIFKDTRGNKPSENTIYGQQKLSYFFSLLCSSVLIVVNSECEIIRYIITSIIQEFCKNLMFCLQEVQVCPFFNEFPSFVSGPINQVSVSISCLLHFFKRLQVSNKNNQRSKLRRYTGKTISEFKSIILKTFWMHGFEFHPKSFIINDESTRVLGEGRKFPVSNHLRTPKRNTRAKLILISETSRLRSRSTDKRILLQAKRF